MGLLAAGVAILTGVDASAVWAQSPNSAAAQNMAVMGLAIESPAEGAVVHQGQTVPVTVISPTGLKLKMVGLIGESPMGFSEVKESVPAQLSMTVPRDMRSGSAMLTATGVTEDEQPVDSPTILVDVEREDAPVSMSTDFHSLELTTQGEEFPVQLLAEFADGSYVDVMESSLVSMASSNESVVTISANRMITAVAPGHATATATYAIGGKTVARAVVQVDVARFILNAVPASLHFDEQRTGTTATRALTLTNSSTSPMKILNVYSGGAFSHTSDCEAQSPLVPGGSCLVTVTFAPTVAGRIQGVVAIETDVQYSRTIVAVDGIATR